MIRTPKRRRAESGFTLLEVMIALLLSMIGLMGTLAIQQTVLAATASTNDAQIALRLATRSMEELKARRTSIGPPVIDQLAEVATGTWTQVGYLDAEGQLSATATPAARFKLQRLVVNAGSNQPYNISVAVGYALDTGAPHAIRLDAERRKTW